MAVNWTREQRQVIESRDRNLLVSAAAGSGKTAVLVERIIRRITDEKQPMDIDRLLVMTFTRAAASEMRERIQAAIEKRLESDPENGHLQRQAVLVQYAQITTIDSFCLHLLREHFDRLDLDPSFRVAEEGELLLMRADVMQQLLEDSYGKEDGRFERFVDAYAVGKTDGGIADTIFQVYDFAQSNPWPEEWLAGCRDELAQTSFEALEQTEWMQFLLRDARLQAEEWADQLREAVCLCEESDGPAAYLPMLQEDLRNVERIAKESASYLSFGRAVGAVRFSRLAAVRAKDGSVDPEKKERASECRKRVKKGIEALQESYLFESPEQVLADLEGSRDGILQLLELAEAFSRRFREKKREKNVVDFNDLEHFALEVLTEGDTSLRAAGIVQTDAVLQTGGIAPTDAVLQTGGIAPTDATPQTEGVAPADAVSQAAGAERPDAALRTDEAAVLQADTAADPQTGGAAVPTEEASRHAAHRPGPVADELSGQYDEILVDEYQDSNLVQETLIRCISRERFGDPNVFMVGDVKQSIYKFRLARPELFMEKYEAYSVEEGPCQKIELHQNFRSRRQVLESVNEVFFGIMTKKLGGIEYTEETALHPGAVFAPRDDVPDDDLCTELLLLDTSEETLEELDDDLSDYTSRELEAGMLAARIRELTDGEDGFSVWDGKTGSYRRAGYGDIVILLRSVSGWAECFAEVLTRNGIPAFAESRTGYFNTTEVETILNLLAVLDNPIQDIPLAASLKAPFGRITDEELAHIIACQKTCADRHEGQEERGGLYDAVMRYLTSDSEEKAERAPGDSLYRRLQEAMSLFDRLRAMAVYLPMHELLYKIYDETGYYDYASAMPGGEVRKANLDMLVQKAADYESTSYRGVFHFIRYIEKLKKYNTDFGEAAAGGQEGAVRIMSIHKSKGLEFPIVFLAGLGKNFNRQDTRGKLLIDADLGIGTEYLDSERRLKGPTLKKNVMKRRMELDALGEELRVLYVAMTRAKEKLILTAAVKKLADRREKWSRISPVRGQIPYTVLSQASSCLDWILMSLQNGSAHIRVVEKTAAGQLRQEMGEQLEKALAKEELRLGKGAEDAALRSLLARSFSYRYPHADELRMNTKLSVSELKKAGMEEAEEETAFLPTIPRFLEEKDGGGQAGGAIRGTAYHRVMELLPFSQILGEGQGWGGMETGLAAAETEKPAGETEQPDIQRLLSGWVEQGKMSKEAAGLVWKPDIAAFLNTDLARRMAKADAEGKLWREKQFVVGIPARQMGDWDSDERILVQGIIDAFFQEEDGLVLVDYKTDYVDSAEVLLARYRTQLAYYRRALNQITGLPVKEAFIYSWRMGVVAVL